MLLVMELEPLHGVFHLAGVGERSRGAVHTRDADGLRAAVFFAHLGRARGAEHGFPAVLRRDRAAAQHTVVHEQNAHCHTPFQQKTAAAAAVFQILRAAAPFNRNIAACCNVRKKPSFAGLFTQVRKKVSLVGTFCSFGCIRALRGASSSAETVVSAEGLSPEASSAAPRPPACAAGRRTRSDGRSRRRSCRSPRPGCRPHARSRAGSRRTPTSPCRSGT